MMNLSRVQKYKKKPGRKRPVARVLGFILSLGLALTLVIGVFLVMLYSANLPPLDLASISNVSQTAMILDKDGTLVTRVSGVENRVKVSLADLPAYLIDGVISVEDTRFYEHHGIDVKRIASALWVDLKNMSFSEGASTITQQVVKNSQLTQEKTVSRKVTEALLALQLERMYGKDEILEAYLNIIPYGEGAYGVEAASQLYFGKPASELTLPEAALIAGIPRSPTYFSPYDYPEAAVQRRNLVLRLMADEGKISQSEMREAQESPLGVVDPTVTGYPHGFFVDYVLDCCMEILGMSRTELIQSGYRIQTTMDQDAQDKLEELFANPDNFPISPANGDTCQAAAVVLDSQTGALLGMMGGRTEGDYQLRSFNRATSAYRQPGSTIKPLAVYAPALEWFGYTPATPVLDEPITIAGYHPTNYDGVYRGRITVREALSKSINVPAVRIFHDIGPAAGEAFLETVGIDLPEEDKSSLSVALGGISRGVTPMELAQAYTVFPSEGKYYPGFGVLRIEDAQGNVLWEHVPAYTGALSEETAFLINDMLLSSTEEGTASVLKSLPFPVAAKTGTVQLPNTADFNEVSGLNDSWVVAYTPDCLVSVWMGFDRTTADTYLPPDATGGSFPARFAKEVLASADAGNPGRGFQKPLNVVEVPLDKAALGEGEMLIASPQSSGDEVVKEYFASGNIPKATAPPHYEMPGDLSVKMLPSGYPCVQFTAQNGSVSYRLMRQERDGGPETIAVLNGDGSRNVRFVDFSAVPGTEYGYSINIQGSGLAASPVFWTGTSTQGESAQGESEENESAQGTTD